MVTLNRAIHSICKANAQKNTLLQVAQAYSETKTCKRVFFSPSQENFFPSLPFLIKLFFQCTGFVLNRTDIASNVNCFGQSMLKPDTTHLRKDRRASANRVGSSARVSPAGSYR